MTHIRNSTLLVLLFALVVSGLHAQESARITLVKEQVLDADKEDFSVVNHVRVNGRGDIALTLRRDFKILIYDHMGRRIASIGRRGSGPGEFQSPQAQGWFGDTVWIYDSGLRRSSYYTRTGVHIRTWSNPAATRPVSISNGDSGAILTGFYPQVRTADGTFMGNATAVGNDRRPSALGERILAGVTKDGVGFRVSPLTQDRRWSRSIAMVDIWEWKSDGTEAVILGVSDLTETGSHVTILRVNSAGALIGRSQVPYRGTPLTRQQRDRILKQPQLHGVEPVTRTRIPPVIAPVVGIELRADGMLLLAIGEPDDRSSLVLIDRRGIVRGKVSLPPRSYLGAVSGDRIWLRERDADDLISVVRYRLNCVPATACR